MRWGWVGVRVGVGGERVEVGGGEGGMRWGGVGVGCGRWEWDLVGVHMWGCW